MPGQRGRDAATAEIERVRDEALQARRETEDARSDAEQARREADQAHAEIEQARRDAGQARTDAEQARRDADEARREADEARADAERARDDLHRARGDADRARSEAERGVADAHRARIEAKVERIAVTAYTIPTDFPEADGTIEWDKTTLVLVEATAAGVTGLGYSYADVAAGSVINGTLAGVVTGRDALDTNGAWLAMSRAVRNSGRPGIAATAISAVDNALWDLKCRLLGVSLAGLLGRCRDGVPIYGSGGFTSYPIARLQAQLAGWAQDGIGMVKMKVGTDPDADVDRVRAAREAIGPAVELFVDANGAYSRKQALWFAEEYAELDVTWFEEPVSSDDLDGLRLIRDRSPDGMDVAAGEYGYTPDYFERMLAAESVDVLQADATRCLGITGWMAANALCEARSMPLSAHCAPSIHAHPAAAATKLRHIEYFHDHVRIEHMLFDGVLEPRDGRLWPDLSRPGLGLELKRSDAERWRV